MNNTRKPIQSLKTAHRRCIELEIEHPFWNTQQLADEIGVVRESVWNWQHSPIYKEELNRRLHEEWESYAKEAQDVMRDLMLHANKEEVRQKATAYVMDSTGYKATDKVEVSAPSVNITIDYATADKSEN